MLKLAVESKRKRESKVPTKAHGGKMGKVVQSSLLQSCSIISDSESDDFPSRASLISVQSFAQAVWKN